MIMLLNNECFIKMSKIKESTHKDTDNTVVLAQEQHFLLPRSLLGILPLHVSGDKFDGVPLARTRKLRLDR